MILEMTRGHIRVAIGDRIVTLQGEMYLPGYGSPDFVVYRNLIERWDPPFENERIDDRMRSHIITVVQEEMKEKGLSIEVE